CYRLGEEIVTYRDVDELLETIRVLLADPDKAEMIRLAGYRRALAEHTWEMRFDKVFRLLGVLA
ncbi:MAG: glycosyltransferase family protein, partial [Thermodesulfobacteriota bacterium]